MLLAMCAAFGVFVSPAGAAAPPPAISQFSQCTGAGDPCLQVEILGGSGGDLHYQLGNQCSAGAVCDNELILTGSFNRVVVDRGNQCTTGATCTIVVNTDGSSPYNVPPATINSLKVNDGGFRVHAKGGRSIVIGDRCDATAVCTKTTT